VERDPGVGHPGQPGVPQVVPPQMFESELGHDLIPMGRISQDRCADPAAPGTDEQATSRLFGGIEFRGDQFTQVDDDWNLAGTPAFRTPHAGHLTDPDRTAPSMRRCE
jgi:hypothetical protein